MAAVYSRDLQIIGQVPGTDFSVAHIEWCGSDAARPYAAIKPRGFLNRCIGRYSTRKSAQQAVRQWNKRNGEAVS